MTVLCFPLVIPALVLALIVAWHIRWEEQGEEYVTEVLGEIELTKEIIASHFWLHDILSLLGTELYTVYQWEPGEKIQVVWQHKVWPEGSEYNE